MVKIPVYINLEYLDVLFIPSHHLLKLDGRTQSGSLMGYTKSIATMKWWYSHTKRLKYCSSEIFDEYNNKLGKGLSTGSNLVLGTYISVRPTLKIDLSDHTFIKYDIFEGTVSFPTRGTTIGIVTQYCKHHNMSYIYQ